MEKLTINQFVEIYGKCYQHHKGEYAPMDLPPKYLKILNEFDENRHNIVLKKSRQVGLTTLMMLYAAYKLLTGENEKMMYLYFKCASARHFLSTLKTWLIDNHIFDKDDFEINNMKHLKLKNGNEILIGSFSIDSVRGYDLDTIFIDEAAHISELGEKMKTITPHLGVGGRLIMGSSPNGFEYFQSVWSNDNGFSKNTLHWSDTTRFDSEWYEEMKRHLNNNPLQIKQELDGEFINFKEEKSKTISLRVEEDLYNSIGKQLLVNNESTSEYLRRLIQEDITRH